MTSWTPAIVVALMVIGASAFAEVSIPPAKARQLLAHLPGMRARPDQHKEGLGWTCVTPYDVLRHSSSDGYYCRGGDCACIAQRKVGSKGLVLAWLACVGGYSH